MNNVEMETKNPSTFQGEGLLANDEQILLSSLQIYKRREAKATASVKKLRAVIYARVSTKEQADEDKTSLPAQLEKCKAVIKSKGWEFIEEYQDGGISGHLTDERHGLQSMLRDAREKKFDLIVVKDFDRFARNKDSAAIIRQELKELGIQVYSLNTPIEPRSRNTCDPDEDDMATITETISDMRSDLERKQIRRRMKEGKENVAKAGSLPNRVPYGYKVNRYFEGRKAKREIVIDEEAASRVKFIFSEFISGKGVRKITIEMNNKGWKSPKGGLWSSRGIKYILGNAVYIGKVLWGWRHAKYAITREWIAKGREGYMGNGNHQPIIDRVIFLKAQEIRASRNRGARGGVERSRGILTGIAKCIRCGHGVSYQKRRHSRKNKNPNWNDTVTHEYVCTGYKYSGICSPRVMSATKLESEVLNHIKNLYCHPKVQEKIVYDRNDYITGDREKEIKRLEREIMLYPEKENRHLEAYEKGVESLEQYQNSIARLREENMKMHVERDSLTSLCSLSAQKEAVMAKLVESMKDFDTFWNALQLDEKKLILRSIIREIRAGDGKVEIDFIL